MRTLRRFLAGGLATTAVALTGFTVQAQPPKPDAPRPAPPGPKDGPPPPPDARGPGPAERDGPPHVADLRRAYELLADAAPPPRPPGKKDDPAADGRRLYDAARKLYREAVKANEGDAPPAPELAAAAHDAARGLKHFTTASRPADPDLPRPAAGPRVGDPWEPARGELQRAKDRLDARDADGGPVGKGFVEAAKRAYAGGREAYEAKEYEKAAELARAAEAWSHVGEHLDRAKDGKGAAPPPPDGPRKGDKPAPPTPPDGPRKGDKPPPDGPEPKGKPEPRGKDAPPPPAPLDDKGPKPPPKG